MASKKNNVLVGVLLAVVALLVALVFHARSGIRQIDEQLEQIDAQLGKVNGRLERPISVRLANRTVELGASSPFPKVFAQHQTPSVRGTLPYLVVCAEPVSKASREQVAACGARVLGVVSSRVLLVETDESALAKMASTKDFSGACELMPLDKVSADLASAEGEVDVTLVPLAEADVSAVSNAVVAVGGRILATPAGRVRAHLPAGQVGALAVCGDVRWIERFTPARLLNDVAVNPGLLNVRKAWAAPHGLTGAGQIVTISDSGLDTGNPDTVMADFAGRIRAIVRARTTASTRDLFGHGTHTAGSLAGDGALSSGQFKGVAYGADLWVWAVVDSGGYIDFQSYGQLFSTGDPAQPAFIHSASWGGVTHAYDSESAEIDQWLWEHPDVLVVFAAGNGWLDDAWHFTNNVDAITSQAAAKNVLAVGATESYRPELTSYRSYADNPSQMFSQSSCGPMPDGRVKPDLCAPGTMILSTLSTQASNADLGWGTYSANAHYTYNGGTSMATPLVAGCAALVRQWLVERRGFAGTPPTAALMKAILIGGAHDLFGDAGTNVRSAAPNGQEGWGRVDLGETLYPSNRSVRLVDRIPYAAGTERVWRVETTRAAPLDVQLVWIDCPATPERGGGLINDLDLVVSNRVTGAVWWGNGVVGGDRTNNVEGVRIASAPAGTYDVRVHGVEVPYDSTEGGAAALYMRGAFRRGLATVFR